MNELANKIKNLGLNAYIEDEKLKVYDEDLLLLTVNTNNLELKTDIQNIEEFERSKKRFEMAKLVIISIGDMKRVNNF